MKFSAEVTPPRPKLEKEGIADALEDLANKLDIDIDDLAFCFNRHDDGYELAKSLERHGCYDLNLNDANELDTASSIVREAEQKLERLWIESYNVQPPFENGTRISEGIIDSVCPYTPATYRVKQTGCTQEGRFLLVKFERAKLAEG